jgi:hypothetical protein
VLLVCSFQPWVVTFPFFCIKCHGDVLASVFCCEPGYEFWVLYGCSCEDYPFDAQVEQFFCVLLCAYAASHLDLHTCCLYDCFYDVRVYSPAFDGAVEVYKMQHAGAFVYPSQCHSQRVVQGYSLGARDSLAARSARSPSRFAEISAPPR